MYSKRDIYPNYSGGILSTGENTIPESSEQAMYPVGETQGLQEVVTKKDMTSMVLAVLLLLGMLFLFGVIK